MSTLHNYSETRPSIFSSGSAWVRFNKYDIYENSKGDLYITPERNAKMEFYKPFKCFPHILRDFLEIAMSVPEEFRYSNKFFFNYKVISQNDKFKIGKAIMQFAEKYGLLGLFWLYVKEFRAILDEDRYYEEVKLDQGSLFHIHWLSNRDRSANGLLDYLKYFRYFFVKPDSPIIPNCNTVNGQLAICSSIENIDFMSNYCEPLSLFLGELQHMFSFINVWNSFLQSGQSPDYSRSYALGKEISWNDVMKFYRIGQFTPSINFDKVWQVEWDFVSLNDALGLMCLNDVVSANQRIRFCQSATCKRPYVAKSSAAKYCSVECGNVNRVRRCRMKQMDVN